MALHGIKNMHVGMIGENCYGWILAYLTTLCGDNVFVPIDRELPVREIINVVHHSDCEALFLTKSYADKLLPFADEMPAIRKYIVFGLTEDELKNLQNDKVVRAEDLIRYGGAALTVGDRSYLDARRGEYELKMLVYTSGTQALQRASCYRSITLYPPFITACRFLQSTRQDFPYCHITTHTKRSATFLYRFTSTQRYALTKISAPSPKT